MKCLISIARLTKVQQLATAILPRFFATLQDVPSLKDEKKIDSVFRTSESSPVNHTQDHHGLFYTLPEEDKTNIIRNGVNKEYRKQMHTFNEACFMIREPALEIFDLLRNIPLGNPVHKIIVYGRNGTGKTMTLAHTLHYGARDGWMLVHVPWPNGWTLYSPEVVQSTHNPSRYDLPLYAMEWLADFKIQNTHILPKYKTHQQYKWSNRDIVESGAPLLEVVDLGLNRGKFSNDCIGVIVKEIKRHACDEGLKVLAIIDGINAFWQPTKLFKEFVRKIPPENISLIHHFKKLLKPDWNNAVVVASVDRHANILTQREEYTPKYLLGKEGFASLDPYIPILVDDYTDKEFYSSMQYYFDRHWIQHEQGQSDQAVAEFKFLSGKNPFLVMKTVGPR